MWRQEVGRESKCEIAGWKELKLRSPQECKYLTTVLMGFTSTNALFLTFVLLPVDL